MRLPTIAIILPLLMLSSPFGVAQEQVLQPGFSNGIPYLSGGIGDEELEELDRARPHYNTRLVLAESSGSYVSNVTLKVTTVLGEPIISLSSAGPLVLLQLPPGSYLINAKYEGRTAQKRFDVRDNSAQTIPVSW